ncbi:MAG: putative sugar nucleotidyl transferase [Bacteroidia bacterium]|nr:putative sugar nucleotidyl transferase [Bacteroidia bacterium]MDW8415953.1 putative sugar nucleotidyl transferase [Bacteroidia bacterium]
MRIGLFEDEGWKRLLPLSRVRPVWHIWWGMDRLADKWQRYYGWEVVGYWTPRTILHQLFPPAFPSETVTWINARLLPIGETLPLWLRDISPDILYVTPEGGPVALRTRGGFSEGSPLPLDKFRRALVPSEVSLRWLGAVTDLFSLTGQVIYEDWRHLREKSAPLPASLSVRGTDNIFFHPTAKAGFSTISAEEGPVWIGPHAELQDGSIIQHTNVIGPYTSILLGARIRTHNSFGPYCKVGGEVGQSTILGYSNKAHDGFLGHSVIGEWCNIGAGSNTSNLKNTYGFVQLYDPDAQALQNTGLQFCGLIMGDYARCGIQTPFTTGCMVDIFANVVRTTFTPKYIPPFFWDEKTFWECDKAIEAARRMYSRRNKSLSEAEETLLRSWYALLVKAQ